MNAKEANYRIVRYDGKYRVEVLDKPVGHWYIVASNIMSLDMAVEYCEEHFEKGEKTFDNPSKWVKAHCIDSFNPVSEPDRPLHGITLIYENDPGVPYVIAMDEIIIKILKL